MWAGHPWVYAQAVGSLEGTPEAGDVVVVVDPRGQFLGRGFYSPDSAIPVRIVTWDPDEPLDDEGLGRRVDRAVSRRRRLLGLPGEETDGFRLVHAEGDDLPGLVVDRYGDVLCVQLLTTGMWRRREALFDRFVALAGVGSVVVLPGGEHTVAEGPSEATTARGPEVDRLRFRERALGWEVPLDLAQKTGFYFDQRENRARVEAMASGRRVLDVYSYVGGFALAAARGGAAEVVALDRSEAVLATGRELAAANGLEARVRFVRADARRELSVRAEAGEKWEIVILDPPKLAPTTRHLPRAQRAYEAMNANGFRLVSAGGILVTCSCSAAMTAERFVRTLSTAAAKAGRRPRLLRLDGQAPDHPTPPAFAEGRYLTCAVVEVE